MSDERPTGRDVAASRTNRREGAQNEWIPRDDIYELLASARRREIVAFLATRPGDTVHFDDLVAVVVAAECPDSGPGTHRGRITADVYHVHLPKLDGAGVVSYDPEAETVEYHGSERLESLLVASESPSGVHG